MKRRISLKRRKQKLRPRPVTNQERAKELEKRKTKLLFRVSFVYGTVVVACVGLIVRLAYLQISKGVQFRAEAKVSTVATVPVLPARGRIYDANGILLAYDKPEEALYYTQIHGVNTSPLQIQKLATVLGPVLGMPSANLRNEILANMQTSDYSTIPLLPSGQYLNAKQVSFIAEHAASLPGISLQVNSQRAYPFGDLAGHLLGYVGPITAQQLSTYVNPKPGHYQYLENQVVGQAGIEAQYEKYLRGEIGQEIADVSSHSNTAIDASYTTPPVAGDNIQLTLDAHLQAVTQQSLYNAVLQYDVQNHTTNTPAAAAVVMNVHTGAILAMASDPYIDPNWFTTNTTGKHAKYLNTPGVYDNNVIQNPNYPGSTIKPANMLVGLQKGAITPNYTYYDAPGPLYIGTRAETEDASYGLVNDEQALTVSDDKFFYNLGLMLGKWIGSSGSSPGAPYGGNLQAWRDTYFIRGIMDLVDGERRFGIGELTGIDLPGEQTGSFYIENNQGLPVQLNVPQVEASLKKTGSYANQGSPFDLAMMAFGQGQQVTPIELVQYVAAIANGGKRLQPHLLDKVFPPGIESNLSSVKEKPILTFKTHVLANIKLNPTYLDVVRKGMDGVTHQPNGTAYASFYNAPYNAAGKTGTATIYLNGQKTNDSVFEGYAPYNNPQIAVVVMIQGAGYGAASAAPVTRQVMDTYFDEHHVSFMPKSQWTHSSLPSGWFTLPAYTVPEKSH